MAWFLIECFLWRLIMIIIKISYQRIVKRKTYTRRAMNSNSNSNSNANRTNGRLRLLLTICQTHTAQKSNINISIHMELCVFDRIDTANRKLSIIIIEMNERRDQANKRTRIVSLSFSCILFHFVVWDFSSCFMALIALQKYKRTRFVTLNGFYDANRFSVVVAIVFSSSSRWFFVVVNGWYFNFNHRFKQHFMVIIELRATETNSERITII